MTATLHGGVGTVSDIVETSGLTRQTIYRIKGDRTEAEAALAAWGA